MNYMAIPGMRGELIPLRNINFETVQNAVSKHYDIPLFRIFLKLRAMEYVQCRQMIYYILSKYGNHTCIKIAREYNKDHTTILYGIKTMQNLIDTDQKIKNDLHQILDIIRYS